MLNVSVLSLIFNLTLRSPAHSKRTLSRVAANDIRAFRQGEIREDSPHCTKGIHLRLLY